MGTDVQFALVPKSLVNLSMADNLDVSDALRPVLTERRRSDTKEAQRIVDAVKAVAVGGTVGDLRRLSDGEWRSLEGVPAMCRILLKYAVRQSARTGNPPAPPVSSPPAAAAPVESFLDILASEFNYGLPFDMSLYTSNLTALSTMGFKRDEAMEALVLTENKSVDLALEVLLSDATRRKRKREESAARLGRQKPAGSVAASPSSGGGAASAATTEELTTLRRQLESERKEKLKAQDDMKGHLGSADRIAYREYMRGMIADQTVTVLSLQHLKTYRDSKNITPADHEAVLKELGLTEEGFEKMKKFQSRAKGDGDCVVCLDKPKDHVIFNCMHLCLCEDCVAVLSKRGSKCPMCSKRITKIMKVFV